jgi:hypothetical protein
LSPKWRKLVIFIGRVELKDKVLDGKLEGIKRAVSAMIKHREEGDVNPLYKVNELWRSFERYMEYIRYLPNAQLMNIRAHTGMAFFANVWHKDYHDGQRIKSESEALSHPLIQRYLKHAEGLPDLFQCSEPCSNELVASIGIGYRGKVINHDTVREQACIANLYNLGVLGPLEGKSSVVVELGAGYGQLAHSIGRGLGDKCCYICVDYPESLFWSSTFLSINNEPDSIYVYDPTTASVAPDLAQLIERYRFIMLPNYLVEHLQQLKIIDLVINQNSFQEMGEGQVQKYLELFSSITTGWLYSYNSNRQIMNLELKTPIFDFLNRYFTGYPSYAFYNKFYEGTWHLTDQKYLFLGHRSDQSAPNRSLDVSRRIWISGRSATVDFE